MMRISLFLPVLVLGAAVHAQPNVVLILADDMGYECLKANGGEDYKTPNIDRLSAGGVRFEQCFANPKCTPSRVKLMTGKYNSRNYVSFGVLDRSQTTFGNMMKEVGYTTAIAGKWQLGQEVDSPQHFGFDQACLWQHTRGRNPKGRGDTRYSNPWLEINGVEKEFENGQYGPDICSQFLCDFITENKEKPFFVYYPMILPHWPWVATPDSPDWDPTNMGATENKSGTLEDQKRHFGEMVEYADKLVGKVIQTLEKNGLRENTLVIFLGDNGTDKPIITKWNGRDVAGAKGRVVDEGTRVPCIINFPGTVKPMVDRESLVEFSDFLPTICDFTPARLPEGYPGDGQSLAPLLLQNGERNKPYVYLTFNAIWARNHTHGVKLLKGKNEELEKYNGHYVAEVVATPDERDKAVFDQLRAVIQEQSKAKEAGLLYKKPAKKKTNG